MKEGSSPTLSAYSRSKRFLIAGTTPEKEKNRACPRSKNRRLRHIKNPLNLCQADPEIVVLWDASNYPFLSRRVIASGHLSFDSLHHAGAGAALSRGFENTFAARQR